MKKDTYSKPRHILNFSVFIATLCSMMLISCKDNSASLEEPDNFENCGDSFKDTDGNTYQTVQIGGQCWMAEDLRTTSYLDGTSIPNITENNEWASLSTGAWAYYANDDFNSDINGKLYNWYAVNDSKGICPAEWKVFSDDDWKTLEIELGMTQEETNSLERRGDGVGDEMRDNEGFSASINGIRAANGVFSAGDRNGSWWSSSEAEGITAWTRFFRDEFTGVYRSNSNKPFGLSVRCVLN